MAFQKGHPGYRPKGSKNKTTLLKEERRAIFEEITSERWREVIYDLPAVYIADQFMGKAMDNLAVKYDIDDAHLKEIHEQLIELRRRKKSEGT